MTATACKAEVPPVLYLVFETVGHVSAFETLDEAGGSLEWIDLVHGHYLGAYSDQGEIINMIPNYLWINFSPSGTLDRSALQTLVRSCAPYNRAHMLATPRAVTQAATLASIPELERRSPSWPVNPWTGSWKR